jgi:hypothetical protein
VSDRAGADPAACVVQLQAAMAIESERMKIVPELSPETIAALDEARAALAKSQAPAA